MKIKDEVYRLKTEEKQRRRLLGDQSRIIKNYHDRRNENWRIVEGKMLDGMDEEAVTGCMRDLYGVNRLRKGRRRRRLRTCSDSLRGTAEAEDVKLSFQNSGFPNVTITNIKSVMLTPSRTLTTLGIVMHILALEPHFIYAPSPYPFSAQEYTAPFIFIFNLKSNPPVIYSLPHLPHLQPTHLGLPK